MTLSKLIENFDSKIVGGSEHCWKCFGPDARYLDFESDYAFASIIFDSKDQTVYQASVSKKEDIDDSSTPYQWFNPDFRTCYLDECKEREIDPHYAWDNVKYLELETIEDYLEKSHAMFNNLPFDRRISVPLDLDDDVILQLALEAHKRDITMNKMVEIVLQKAIDDHNSQR